MVDLTKYKILDAGAAVNGHGISVISGGSLQPHGYAVIAKDPTTLGGATYPLFKAALAAKTSGDTFILKDDSGNVADSVSFTSDQGASGDGNSLQKSDSGWIAAAPTPGATNATASAPVNTDTDNTSTTTSTSTNTGTTNHGGQNVVSTTVSTHYSYLPLSTLQARENLSAGAGRARLGSVGSPLSFKAQIDAESGSGARFAWSFGDGSVGSGESVDHVYKHPGDYVIVLNASNGSSAAVSRAQVKIVDPKLSITLATPTSVEVSNDSKYEVNLYGRELVSEGKKFTFPQDTIILPGQSIVFDHEVTGLAPFSTLDVALLDLSSGDATREAIAAKPAINTELIASLKEKLLAVENRLAVLAQAELPDQTVLTEPQAELASIHTEVTKKETPQVATALLALKISTTSTTAAPAPTKSPSWFQTLKHFFGLK
ncbi:PKD domain-containing protein [Candidatus Parcubacteria bacterium]|nr:PKD domain-containing protein [Candidatus Parcubacteria bacterium]